MPPNRKTNVVLEDLPTIDVAQLKLEAATTTTSKPSKSSTEPEVSYWDWPAHEDSLVRQILQEEKIRLCLSAVHIEENLVKESQRFWSESKQEEEVTDAANDDYWNMTSSSSTAEAEEIAPQGAASSSTAEQEAVSASYWNWPCGDDEAREEFKERMIQRIFKEERARKLTSIGFYEQGLVDEASRLTTNHTPLNADHDSYWACYIEVSCD